MHLRNWRSQSHSLQTTYCPWLGRGQVMWPIRKFLGSNHITRTAEPSRQILYTSRQYQFDATGWHITNKRAWLWSCDCFKTLPLVVMQRDARVCQRQLSYLLDRPFCERSILCFAHVSFSFFPNTLFRRLQTEIFETFPHNVALLEKEALLCRFPKSAP